MHELKCISVSGFRRLATIQNIELRPLTVLIGANGVGKTSFLDVFSLLAASASAQLNQRISDMSGLSSMLTRGIASELVLETEMVEGSYPALQYHLKITPSGVGYAFPEEVLSQQSNPTAPQPFKHIESRFGDIRYHDPGTRHLVPPTWKVEPLETSLAQVPKLYQQPENFRRRLASLAYYAALGFDAGRKSPVRLPQQMRPATLPGPSGEDLVSCLFSLRETDRDRFDTIQDTLTAAFPAFERLDFPPVAAGTLAMTWKERAFTKPIFTHELSEGTLRFLWLVTLLQSPGLTEITLIDEPEVSLHPDMLRILVNLFREAALRTQLIIATQSERLVRFLKPSEVLVCDLDNGQTQMRWADTLDLDQWLGDYALDELWRLGRIGGRP